MDEWILWIFLLFIFIRSKTSTKTSKKSTSKISTNPGIDKQSMFSKVDDALDDISLAFWRLNWLLLNAKKIFI